MEQCRYGAVALLLAGGSILLLRLFLWEKLLLPCVAGIALAAFFAAFFAFAFLMAFCKSGIIAIVHVVKIAPAKKISGAGINNVVIVSALPISGKGILRAWLIALPIIGPISIGIST